MPSFLLEVTRTLTERGLITVTTEHQAAAEEQLIQLTDPRIVWKEERDHVDVRLLREVPTPRPLREGDRVRLIFGGTDSTPFPVQTIRSLEEGVALLDETEALVYERDLRLAEEVPGADL